MAGPEKSQERIEAARLYAASDKSRGVLKEIAAQVGKSEALIRKWKAQDGWDSNGDEPVTLPDTTGNVTGSEPEPHAQSPPPPPVDQKIIQSVEANGELNDKQKLFCLYYSRSFNATRSYLKAYGCSYESAMVRGNEMLRNVKVRDEIARLKRIKAEDIMISEEDIVELHVRIAFAAMDDFLRWGVERIPYTHKGKPVVMEDADDLDEDGNPKQKVVTHDSNAVWFLDSSQVDGQLVAEVSQTRDGARIKLRNADISMRFLETFFTQNPMHKYRMEYEARKMEVELMKIQAGLPPANDETGSAESNFVEALKGTVSEVWADEDES